MLHIRNNWRTELFSLEEMVDEEGNCTYYLDNVGIICPGTNTRKQNIVALKEHLYKVIRRLESVSEEEVMYNIDKNMIEDLQ